MRTRIKGGHDCFYKVAVFIIDIEEEQGQRHLEESGVNMTCQLNRVMWGEKGKGRARSQETKRGKDHTLKMSGFYRNQVGTEGCWEKLVASISFDMLIGTSAICPEFET